MYHNMASKGVINGPYIGHPISGHDHGDADDDGDEELHLTSSPPSCTCIIIMAEGDIPCYAIEEHTMHYHDAHHDAHHHARRRAGVP